MIKTNISILLNHMRFYLWRIAEVAQCFTNVLHHSYVVLSAVVPELRGGKLPPQNHSVTWRKYVRCTIYKNNKANLNLQHIKSAYNIIHQTSFNGSDKSDEESSAVIQRQIDVEYVFRRHSTNTLDERWSPDPLMGHICCFRKTSMDRNTNVI